MPLPVPPSSATVCPGSAVKLMSSSPRRGERSAVRSYWKLTCSKRSAPRICGRGRARGDSRTSGTASSTSNSRRPPAWQRDAMPASQLRRRNGCPSCTRKLVAATRVPRLMRPRMTSRPPTYSVSPRPSASSRVSSGRLSAWACVTRMCALYRSPADSRKDSSCARSRPNALTTRMPVRLSCQATDRRAVCACTFSCSGRSQRPMATDAARITVKPATATTVRRQSSQASAATVPTPVSTRLRTIGRPKWKNCRTASTSAVVRDIRSPVCARSWKAKLSRCSLSYSRLRNRKARRCPRKATR